MRQSDPYQPSPYVTLEHPEWSVNATIYQINTRQFTEEGTFRAAEEHLPRLKELGAVILWLMPIHEIGRLSGLRPKLTTAAPPHALSPARCSREA